LSITKNMIVSMRSSSGGRILRLPRWICLSESDNELPIDLDNPQMVEVMLSELKGTTQATIVEMFPEPDQLCARGPSGRYVHEIIVPFVKQRKQVIDAGADPVPSAQSNRCLSIPRVPARLGVAHAEAVCRRDYGR
jgi:hypothetical protein